MKTARKSSSTLSHRPQRSPRPNSQSRVSNTSKISLSPSIARSKYGQNHQLNCGINGRKEQSNLFCITTINRKGNNHELFIFKTHLFESRRSMAIMSRYDFGSRGKSKPTLQQLTEYERKLQKAEQKHQKQEMVENYRQQREKPELILGSQEYFALSSPLSIQARDQIKEEATQTAAAAEQPTFPHSLSVSIMGAPNAGKSTFINNLIGEKISGVSKKSQTTRTNNAGILTHENVQIVFQDTPGVIPIAMQKARSRDIVTSAWEAASKADVILLIVDVAGPIGRNVRHLLTQIEANYIAGPENERKDVVLLANKADLMSKDKIRERIETVINPNNVFKDIFVLSALRSDLSQLKQHLLSKAVPREWQYSSGVVTDLSTLERVLEVIREKIFVRFSLEIPYVSRHRTIKFMRLENGTIYILHHIYVLKEPVKKMLIGKEGRHIEWIKQKAQEDFEKIFKVPVRVDLHIATVKKIRS